MLIDETKRKINLKKNKKELHIKATKKKLPSHIPN